MEHTRIIDKNLEQVRISMNQLLKQSPELNGNISDQNRFRLKSGKKYGAVSLIEKELFVINGRINKLNNTTQIRYKVRGNSTFSILAIIIPIMAFPTFLFNFIGTETSNFGKAETVPYLAAFTVVMCLAILLFLMKEKQLKRKGEAAFEAFLNRVSEGK